MYESFVSFVNWHQDSALETLGEHAMSYSIERSVMIEKSFILSRKATVKAQRQGQSPALSLCLLAEVRLEASKSEPDQVRAVALT